jgi:hypothetical protein
MDIKAILDDSTTGVDHKYLLERYVHLGDGNPDGWETVGEFEEISDAHKEALSLEPAYYRVVKVPNAKRG